MTRQDVKYPGDLCQYMSRVVLLIEQDLSHKGGPWSDNIWWFAQELGENEIRRLRDDQLTIIQPA